MKKITNLILAVAVIMTLQNTTNAIQTKAVAEQTQINQNTAKQAKIMTDEVANSSFDKKFETLSEKYINNFRTCEPLHINQYWDVFGLKFGFKLDINGWNADKCSYNFTGKFDNIATTNIECGVYKDGSAMFAPTIINSLNNKVVKDPEATTKVAGNTTTQVIESSIA